MADDERKEEYEELLLDLESRHRRLDEEIQSFLINPYRDQLLLQRLKKEKLRLKDCMEVLRNKLIPDLDA